jgi:hypothetical protein
MMGIEPTTLGLLDPRSNQLSYIGLWYLGEQFTIFECKKKIVPRLYFPTLNIAINGVRNGTLFATAAMLSLKLIPGTLFC